MNINKIVDTIIADLRPAIEEAVKDALKTAHESGEADMRNRILQAAALPAHLAGATGATEPIMPERAPRGLVGGLIAEVLRKHDGLQAVEIERRVLERDNRISPKSVGNELRRFKGQKYRKDNRRLWFLIGDGAEKETAGAASQANPAASDNSNQGGHHETALAFRAG